MGTAEGGCSGWWQVSERRAGRGGDLVAPVDDGDGGDEPGDELVGLALDAAHAVDLGVDDVELPPWPDHLGDGAQARAKRRAKQVDLVCLHRIATPRRP